MLFDRPADLPALRLREMMDDDMPYIGSSVHTPLMTSLYHNLGTLGADAQGRWVSRTVGLAFSQAGHGGDVALRIWDAEGRPLLTAAEYYALLRRERLCKERDEREAVEEATLTLLRARINRNEDDLV